MRGRLVLAALLPGMAAAQGRADPSPAERFLRDGRAEVAESVLYARAERAPRDPLARAALGAWLAARGQLVAGSVLLEEARDFGAEPIAINARLAAIAHWSRDWSRLAALQPFPGTPAEWARARWLAARGTSVAGPDSVRLTILPGAGRVLFRCWIRVGDDSLLADVDAVATGLVLPVAPGRRLVAERFGTGRAGEAAVVALLRFDALVMGPVPATLSANVAAGRARLGLDLVAALAPTVDPRARTVTLRRDGRAPALPPTTPELSLWLDFPGVRLAPAPDRPVLPIDTPAVRALLDDARWTLDLRRGAVRRG